MEISEIEGRIDELRKELQYISKSMQMQSLSSAYRSYRLRNEIIEDRMRRRFRENRRPINVSYYVHIVDQLSYPLLDKMKVDPDFNIKLLASTPSQVNFLRSRGYSAYIIHSKEADYPDLCQNKNEDIADICFSEMPYGILPSLEDNIRPWMISGGWLPKYRDIFSLEEINQSLFCLVRYSYTLANEWVWLKANPKMNVHYCIPYENFPWLYFLESEEHLKYALSRNYWGNVSNYVVSGYPKYDAYLRDPVQPRDFSWKHDRDKKKRIVYTPHFFRSNEFLEETCKSLLDLANTGNYEIVFKPHPNPNAIVDKYYTAFNSHQNAQVVRHSDSSQYIFSTSDLAIISSVSMHADAVFSGIPFISELDEDNFNDIGKIFQSTGYALNNEQGLRHTIERILSGGDDRWGKRIDLRDGFLPPNRSTASDNVISSIKERILN